MKAAKIITENNVERYLLLNHLGKIVEPVAKHLKFKDDTCLEHTYQGWYLCGDISKTNIVNHHVPITEEICTVVKAVIEETQKLSTAENNPRHLLFPV